MSDGFDIVEEWTVFGGRQVRANPKCRMYVGEREFDRECGRPVTTRVNYWPHWSEVWCAEHATAFDEPSFRHSIDFLRRHDAADDLEIPTYLRKPVGDWQLDAPAVRVEVGAQ